MSLVTLTVKQKYTILLNSLQKTEYSKSYTDKMSNM